MKKIKSMLFTALVIGVLCAGTVSARQLRSGFQGSTCGGTCSLTKPCQETKPRSQARAERAATGA